MKNKEDEVIPIKDKILLTPKEARMFTGLSEKYLDKMIDDSDGSFIIYVGTHRKIKRIQFEEYLKDLKFI